METAVKEKGKLFSFEHFKARIAYCLAEEKSLIDNDPLRISDLYEIDFNFENDCLTNRQQRIMRECVRKILRISLALSTNPDHHEKLQSLFLEDY